MCELAKIRIRTESMARLVGLAELLAQTLYKFMQHDLKSK